MNFTAFPKLVRATLRYMLVTVPLLTTVPTPVDAARSSLKNDGGQTSVEKTRTPVKEFRKNPAPEQMLFVNIDANGQPEQSTPPGPHSLRHSFATLNIAQLRDNIMSRGRGGLVLNLFPDVVIKAAKSYVELRGGNNYTWFGHSQDNPDDAVILSVVDGRLAGIVMRDGDLFHIKALASDSYEITEVDQTSFPAESSDEEVVTRSLRKTPKIRPVARNMKQYKKRKYIAVEARFGKFFSIFSTINIGVLTTSAVTFGKEYPNINSEIQLAVDQANWAFASSDVQIQLNLTATATTGYSGSGNPSTDLNRLQGKTDGYMDSIHNTRNSWNWKADIVTLVVNDFKGNSCGRAYTLFNGSNIQDWSEWGFNVVNVNCMAKYFTLTHEVGHNLGAHHDWHVKPTIPEVSNPQVDPWAPSSYSHGYIRHEEKRRTVMAYGNECADRGYECPKYLRFSDPAAPGFSPPLGIPKGQYQAADNHAVLVENRTFVEGYR